jgi:hypothetical protein
MNDRKLVGLQKDCQTLVRDTDRALQKLVDYQQELKSFQAALVSQSDSAMANRAKLWVNSTLFELKQLFNSLNNQYEHCLCLASEELNLEELEGLLSQVKQRRAQLSLKQTAFIEKAEQLKKQAQLNLN